MTYILRPLKSFLNLVLIAALLASGIPVKAQAGEPTILIRDAEIENTLKEWLEPLLKVAEMDPGRVKIIIVQNSQLNAFVAGGSNIFIYTGLIERTENPG